MTIINKISIWIRYSLLANIICGVGIITFSFLMQQQYLSHNSSGYVTDSSSFSIPSFLIGYTYLSGIFLFYPEGYIIHYITVLLLLSGILSLFFTLNSYTRSKSILISLSNMALAIPMGILLVILYLIILAIITFISGMI